LLCSSYYLHRNVEAALLVVPSDTFVDEDAELLVTDIELEP
jgi:hypothetical protein